MIFQISTTKIDEKCFANPMGWVPGHGICKECWIWMEIMNKISLGWLLQFLSSYSTVFGIFSGKFDGIAFGMQWNRSQG